MTPPLNSVVDFEQALRLVAEARVERTMPLPGRIPLSEASGRVLAEPVLADRDQPAFDRSTRDGFAVRAAELTSSQILRLVGEIKAGGEWRDRAGSAQLPPGAALAIMTGAAGPPGADAVLMVEHAVRNAAPPATVALAEGRTLKAGENIVLRGSEARAGTTVLPSGIRLGPAEIALAASCGVAAPAVFRRPRVAIVATGDELVDLGDTPGPRQIRNSNSYALAALVAGAGGEPARLPIAPDTRDDVRDRIVQARDPEGCAADLLLFSGGVSMGDYDLVEEVLAAAGAELLFTGVRMQPGKPVIFGRLPAHETSHSITPECYFFGLPGNPISTEVTFRCFAEPFLRALAGEPLPTPRFAQATLTEEAEGKPGLTRLLPARMDAAGPGVVGVRVVRWQGSGDLLANARANCYAELLPGRTYSRGESVRVLLR